MCPSRWRGRSAVKFLASSAPRCPSRCLSRTANRWSGRSASRFLERSASRPLSRSAGRSHARSAGRFQGRLANRCPSRCAHWTPGRNVSRSPVKNARTFPSKSAGRCLGSNAKPSICARSVSSQTPHMVHQPPPSMEPHLSPPIKESRGVLLEPIFLILTTTAYSNNRLNLKL